MIHIRVLSGSYARRNEKDTSFGPKFQGGDKK